MSATLETLYKTSSGGKTQTWDISVQSNSDGTASYTVVHGQEDGKKQSKTTVISVGKNIGKTNETTCLQQAESEARSKWEKQKDKGYFVKSEYNPTSKVFRPMLAHKFMEHGHKVKYPCYIQAKLDGNRAFAENSNFGISVPGQLPKSFYQLYSRLGNPITTVYHISQALDKIPNDYNIILDGELYIHGVGFQKLVGDIKRDTASEDSKNLEYHVYDCYLPDNPKLSFEDRYRFLSEIHKNYLSDSKVKLVETFKVLSTNELPDIHDKMVDLGYEGIMVRQAAGLYKVDGRSQDLLKLKSFIDDEFEIVGAELDKNDECVFICKMPAGHTFKVKPKGDNAARRAYWQGKEGYVGKMLTIRYFELTSGDNPVPRFPVGIVVRDYE